MPRLRSVAVGSPRREHAKALFAPLGPTYDRYARLLSFGQDPRWRRFLVSRIEAGPGDRVLDVATGTGAVALELQRQKGCSVVGLDQSAQMLEIARARLPGVELVEGEADKLPFPDASFDGLTFTYLLRYVDDPAATHARARARREARRDDRRARLRRAAEPRGARALARLGLRGPPTCRARHLHRLGRRRRLPRLEHRGALAATAAPAAARALARGRIEDVARTADEPRRRRGVLGPPGVSTEARPAFYALAPGGWRDYVTLLHPPYTLWHLSYVVIGAALAPAWYPGRLGAVLAAFFLAVGIGAHALDELQGHPLRTRIPDRALGALAAVSIAGAVAIGFAGAVAWSFWLLAFIAAGAFIVCAYNLELFGGRFHSDLWFAVAWGSFPLLTAYFAAAERIRWEASSAPRSPGSRATPSVRCRRRCGGSAAAWSRCPARSSSRTAPASRSPARR